MHSCRAIRANDGAMSGEVLADGQKQEKVAGEVLADGQTQEMYAGKQFADGLNGSSQGVGGPIGLVGRGEQALASTFFILFLRINMIFYNFVLGF
ncbi:MAG: hypothetical protein ACFN4J_04605 [Segatella oulorum]